MDYFCIALFFSRNGLTALSRVVLVVVSFEACCQQALLSVPITRLMTLPYCTEVHLSFYASCRTFRSDTVQRNVRHYGTTFGYAYEKTSAPRVTRYSPTGNRDGVIDQVSRLDWISQFTLDSPLQDYFCSCCVLDRYKPMKYDIYQRTKITHIHRW